MIRPTFAIILLFLCVLPATAQPTMNKCGWKRYYCVVDGDTVWIQGVKYRLKGYDTPEPTTNICGGAFEKQLAARATARLIDLLNGNSWQLRRTGNKGRYKRELAHIYINGEDVGEILIREGLARRWPDGEKWWCRSK